MRVCEKRVMKWAKKKGALPQGPGVSWSGAVGLRRRRRRPGTSSARLVSAAHGTPGDRHSRFGAAQERIAVAARVQTDGFQNLRVFFFFLRFSGLLIYAHTHTLTRIYFSSKIVSSPSPYRYFFSTFSAK